MATEETQSAQSEGKQEIVFNPKDNRFVFVALLVDMADDVRDVISVMHFCASDPKQAAVKAQAIFVAQGLVKKDHPYYLEMGIIGALPGSQPRVITPAMGVPQDIKRQLLRG